MRRSWVSRAGAGGRGRPRANRLRDGRRTPPCRAIMPRTSSREPRALLGRGVGRAVAPAHLGHQLRPARLEPAEVVLAHPGAQVQRDRRDRRWRRPRRPRFTTASSCSRGVGDARQDRRDHHPARACPPSLSLRHGLDAPHRVRACAARRPARRPRRGSRSRARCSTSRARAASASRSTSRPIRVDLVRIEKGLRRLGERLDDPAGQAVAPLHRLVRVGVGAHRDLLARPARRAQLGAQPLDRVDLDHDAPVEVLADVEAQVLVGRAGEAVDARVAAAAVRVDRPAEGHAGGRRAPG